MKKDTTFVWERDHVQADERIINHLNSSPTLKLYDLKERDCLSVDVSQNDVGACLMQEERPVAHASSTLTDPRKQYAQIENILVIVFGCVRFNQFIWGHECIRLKLITNL